MVQLRDIAERKRLEDQLHRYSEALEEKVQERTREIEQAKQYIESLLENANDVIYTLDSDLRFTYVNSKIEAWGYQKGRFAWKALLVVAFQTLSRTPFTRDTRYWNETGL